MTRPVVVALLVVSLFAKGCSTPPPPLLPPGEDPAALVEEIAARGQGCSTAVDHAGHVEPGEADPPSGVERFASACVAVSGKVAATCLVLGAVCGVVVLAVVSRSPGSGGGLSNVGQGIYNALKAIWGGD